MFFVVLRRLCAQKARENGYVERFQIQIAVKLNGRLFQKFNKIYLENKLISFLKRFNTQCAISL